MAEKKNPRRRESGKTVRGNGKNTGAKRSSANVTKVGAIPDEAKARLHIAQARTFVPDNLGAVLAFTEGVSSCCHAGRYFSARMCAEDVRGRYVDAEGKTTRWPDWITPLLIRCILKDRPEWERFVTLKRGCMFDLPGVEVPSMRSLIPRDARREYDSIIYRR